MDNDTNVFVAQAVQPAESARVTGLAALRYNR